MRKWKLSLAALLLAGACAFLSGCANVDESVLNTQANFTVDINMPYATATPLPAHLNVPNAIVIDQDGKVSVNDATAIQGDFQNQASVAQQAAYQSLTLGNTGTDVQALQARLQALGYFEGEVTGVYDTSTEEAIKRFERTYGTMQTGVATAKLQLKLFAAGAPAYGSEEYENAVVAQYSVLRSGNVGSAVYALQQRLKELGYPMGELNGVYDARTEDCVSLFYTTYGLAASKVASVAMQKQLYADNARPYNENAAMPAPLDTEVEEAPEEELQEEEGADGDGFENLLEDDGEDEQPEKARTSSSGALQPGSSGDRVRAVQMSLAVLGYLDKSAVTGVYDEDTGEAIDRYLLMKGQAGEGELTPELEAKLLQEKPEEETPEPSEAGGGLNVGDSGAEVLKLQNRLIELGYAAGTPDSKYGPATITSVRAFQMVNDLNADGVADPETLDRLYSDDAISYADGKGKLPTPTPVPAPTVGASDRVFYNLSDGAVGSAVTKLQQRLAGLGYLGAKNVTGTYDAATANAVKACQQAMGLQTSGKASASFQLFLYSKAAPKRGTKFSSKTVNYKTLDVGNKGDAVVRLQKRLWKLGYMSTKQGYAAKGKYNEVTRKAVARIQKKIGYTVANGDASPEFQAFLFSSLASRL